MSDTESFTSALDAARPILIDECTLTYDCSEESDCRRCGERMAHRLQAAHDRELRDTTQREYHRGYVDGCRHRETATWQLDQERMEIVRGLREFRCEDIEPWFDMQFWTLLRLLGVESDASTPADCDDVAHLRDRLTHLLGDSNLQDSPNLINKDAEPPSYFTENADFNKLGDRKKVIHRLQALRFDGGSHENLSKIAYAVYPCATGWTCESCDGLRDDLVRLLGGVNEHTRGAEHGGLATGGAGDDCCGDRCHHLHVDRVREVQKECRKRSTPI